VRKSRIGAIFAVARSDVRDLDDDGVAVIDLRSATAVTHYDAPRRRADVRDARDSLEGTTLDGVQSRLRVTLDAEGARQTTQ
jgi:hypothetical protein